MTDKLVRDPRVSDIKQLIRSAEGRFASVLPKHMDVDKLISVAISALMDTPKLLECSRISVLRSVLECSSLGLYPDGVLGHAYILPYKGRAQMVPGYKGYLELMWRSGIVRNIDARWVREGDHFEYCYGANPVLSHIPSKEGEGKLVAAYCVVHFTNGGTHFEVVNGHEVEYIKQTSPGSRMKDSPWNNPAYEPAMWAKTAIRRTAKYVPMTPDLHRAAGLDELAEVGKEQPLIDLGFEVPDPQTPAPAPGDPLAELAANINSEEDELAGGAFYDGKEETEPEPEDTGLLDYHCPDCGVCWQEAPNANAHCPECDAVAAVTDLSAQTSLI